MDEDDTDLKINSRAIIVGTVLILSHLVVIQPSELTGFGVKLSISDPAIIHGSIAVVFLHYYLMVLVSSRIRTSRHVSVSRFTTMREAWTRTKRLPHLGFPAKRFAKGWVTFINGGIAIHATILSAITFVALLFAVVDLFRFVRLIVVHAIEAL